MKSLAFTYWEGEPMSYLRRMCVSSIRRTFGDRHRHLTPRSLRALGISIPKHIAKSKHPSVKYDYLRCALLERFGGWWFDCDILLFRDPTATVRGAESKIWIESDDYTFFRWGKEVPHLEVSVLYARKPHTEWCQRILELYHQQEVFGSDLGDGSIAIESAAYEVNDCGRSRVEFGPGDTFYATSWPDDWQGPCTFDPDGPHHYAHQFYTSVIPYRFLADDKEGRRLWRQIGQLRRPEQVLEQFPHSILAAYIQRFGPVKLF